jgi:uncharacterized integral membrane protein
VTTPEHRPVSAPGTDPTLATPGPVTPAPPAQAPPQSTAPRQRSAGKTLGRTLALALLVFVTVVLVLFVMFNTQTVRISLVFADVRAPLVIALLIAAGLGALLVALAGAVLSARRRNR